MAILKGVAGGGSSLSLTTTGTSGPATLVNGTLNIPQYTGTVTGAGTTTTNAISRWGNTTGTSLLNSGVLIDNSNNVTGMGALSCADITVNTSSNGGISLNSSNANGAGFNLNATTGTNFQFFSTGSGNGPGYFGVYNATLACTPWALYGGNTTTGGAVMYMYSGGVMGFGSSNQFVNAGACDTGISRVSANIMALGNGASGNTTGTLQLFKTTYVSSLPGTLTDGDLVNSSTQKQFVYNAGGNTLYNRALLFSGTSTKTITNTTTETSGLPTSFTGTATIAANTFTVGKTVTILGGGVFSTAVTPGSITVRVKVGSVTIASAVINNILTSASNGAFQFNLMFTVRSVGASGTLACNGNVNYETAALARGFGPLNNAGATAALDTTVSNTIDVTIQWASAQVANSISTTTATMEISG